MGCSMPNFRGVKMFDYFNESIWLKLTPNMYRLYTVH